MNYAPLTIATLVCVGVAEKDGEGLHIYRIILIVILGIPSIGALS
jgi:Na+/serine symporter